MKKVLPIVLVLVAILGGVYLLKGSGGTGGTGGTGGVGKSDLFTGSFEAAVKLGVPMKCTYKVEGNEYEGYVKGKNYRGMIKGADGSIGEVIMKDDCIWTWSQDEAQGIKTCLDSTDMEEGEEDVDIWSQPQGSTAMDMEYNCLPAAITDAKFTPPSDIEFLDLEAMMQGFGQ